MNVPKVAPVAIKTDGSPHPPLQPLGMERSESLQPFLKNAKTPEEKKKAVDSYLKWKRAKLAMDEELLNSDSPLQSVVTVLTSSCRPQALKDCMKCQQKRGLLRSLGLGYQYELLVKFNKTMFKRLIIGNITESLLQGPFSFIEGSGAQITAPISSNSLKLCNIILEALREDCGKFKEIKRAVKGMTKKNPDNKGIDENCICEHMKSLLIIFSDLAVCLQGSTNNNLIINLCTSSTTNMLSEFLSSIVSIILMSQSYSAELQSNPPVSKLNSYLISSCQVMLNRFLASAQEISAPEAKSSIQQLLLQIFVDALARECGLSHTVKDAVLRFENPAYQLRFTQLLSFLYEILLIFDKITDIDVGLLQKCASLLCYLLHISAAPCIVRLSSKCAQLLYKFIDVNSIQTEGLIPLPTISPNCEIAKDFPNTSNVVIHTLRRMGEFVMMKNCTPSSGLCNRVKGNDYYVVMHFNSNDDDVTFLFTALYHWENIHPFFSETYPQTLAAELAQKKDAEYVGMFTNSKLAHLSNQAKSAPKVFSGALMQIEKCFDEVIKATFEDIKAEDQEVDKLRKLKEKNYNRRIKQHIQDARFLSSFLLTRSYVQFPIPLSHKSALELCEILTKAYNKQLEQIPINPFMVPEAKAKKLSGGLTVEGSFPLVYRKAQKSGAPSQAPNAIIIIAKAQLVLSICECGIFERIEHYADGLSNHAIQNRHKSTVEGVGLECLQSPVLIGASLSLTLHELIQLLRSMLVSNAAPSWEKYITGYLQHSLELLVTKKWTDIGSEDQGIILGSLILVGGWSKCVRPGTQVEAIVNNIKSICTVVAGGYGTGKPNVSVIVKGDDSFVMHKISLSQVRPYEEYKWPENIPINEELLVKALLNSHQQCTAQNANIHLPLLIRVLLLKISASRNWTKNGKQTESINQFMEVLADLSKESNAEVTKEDSEEKLTESWERLVENEDKSGQIFYVPKRRSKEEKEKVVAISCKRGESKHFLHYVQPISSYLKSLPGKQSTAHAQEEAALKLLNYWEKNLIPKIQDFVRSSYKPWEFLYYFEQLRDRLRKGDLNKAMEEALEICDRRLPGGCVPPDENQDWSAFIAEECIAGSWARAKIQLKKGSQSSHPLVSRLIRQKITELNVFIKIADWRHQVAICEYTDPETMQKYPMLFPINSLKELEQPLHLPPSSYSTAEHLNDYIISCNRLTANCSLKTFIALWASSTSAFAPSLKQITIPEIINWLVMDELNEDRIEGWIRLASPLIELEDIFLQTNHTETKTNKKNIIDKSLKSLNQRQNEAKTAGNLKKVEELMKQAIKAKRFEEIGQLLEWCIGSWKKLTQEINENRVTMSLTEASEVFQLADAAGTCELAKGIDGNIIFPLHTNIQPKSDIGAVVISFENEAFLSPNSKLRFYSDPQGLNMVHQTMVGKTTIQTIPPIVINDGKVWCHFHQGTTANLPMAVQEKTLPSQLPCCIYFIPAVWNTACWLTESLTTCLLATVDVSAVEKYYKPLVKEICECISKSNAPSILKQFSFVLLNRLMRKMRYIYNVCPYVPGSCIEKLGLNIDWLKTLISELNELRDNEDVGAESLYSEYIQNGAELIASALLPLKTKGGSEEQHDLLLQEKLKVPTWLQSVLNVGFFLNYFRGDGQLTHEIKEEIFKSLSINEDQKKNIILVQKLLQHYLMQL